MREAHRPLAAVFAGPPGQGPLDAPAARSSRLMPWVSVALMPALLAAFEDAGPALTRFLRRATPTGAAVAAGAALWLARRARARLGMAPVGAVACVGLVGCVFAAGIGRRPLKRPAARMP